jgi:crotonobetainyl-CoA:carnitine CoA-transferase CaiB-like acyl-CoA transferase
MRIGETQNAGATRFGRPLDGVRILAIEQMQALPYGTQLLSRLGADVVKVEPLTGESARRAALSYYASLLISMSFARTSKLGRWTGWA